MISLDKIYTTTVEDIKQNELVWRDMESFHSLDDKHNKKVIVWHKSKRETNKNPEGIYTATFTKVPLTLTLRLSCWLKWPNSLNDIEFDMLNPIAWMPYFEAPKKYVLRVTTERPSNRKCGCVITYYVHELRYHRFLIEEVLRMDKISLYSVSNKQIDDWVSELVQYANTPKAINNGSIYFWLDEISWNNV